MAARGVKKAEYSLESVRALRALDTKYPSVPACDVCGEKIKLVDMLGDRRGEKKGFICALCVSIVEGAAPSSTMVLQYNVDPHTEEIVRVGEKETSYGCGGFGEYGCVPSEKSVRMILANFKPKRGKRKRGEEETKDDADVKDGHIQEKEEAVSLIPSTRGKSLAPFEIAKKE